MTLTKRPKLTKEQSELMSTALTLYLNQVIDRLPDSSPADISLRETWLQCWNFVTEVTPGK